jgi:hypothetical protein
MNNLYEADFFQWTQETSDRLRRGEFTKIDVPALVEEVEDLGKREKSALQNCLAVQPFIKMGSSNRQAFQQLASHHQTSAKPHRTVIEPESKSTSFSG